MSAFLANKLPKNCRKTFVCAELSSNKTVPEEKKRHVGVGVVEKEI